MPSSSQPRRVSRSDERGYVLLTLLLIMALMAIFAAAIVPTIKFEMRRDREEEMIHRGVQYSRAIRAYYKKFGRYPVKIEDLESTNNLRFLRKRYKDPMNCVAGKCQDFKLLHFGEVQMTLSSVGGGIAGATPVAALAGNLNASGGAFGSNSASVSSSFVQSSSFGQSGFGQPSTLGQSSLGGNSAGGNTTAGLGSSGNQTATDASTPGQSAGSDSTDSSTQVTTSNGANITTSGTQVIGGPIVGVASATKITDSTIREFNHKKKYKDWVFIYDPMQDQGRLITTPYQPQLQSFGQPNLNGQNGTNGTNGTSNGFGNNNGFGTGNSFGSGGNSPNGGQNPSPQNPGYGNPGQPNNSPQSPQ